LLTVTEGVLAMVTEGVLATVTDGVLATVTDGVLVTVVGTAWAAVLTTLTGTDCACADAQTSSAPAKERAIIPGDMCGSPFEAVKAGQTRQIPAPDSNEQPSAPPGYAMIAMKN
jgi:hypothetical protein